jgi:DNA-binding MarR family transcriptional regulator
MYAAYMQVDNSLGALVIALDDGFASAFAESTGTGRSGSAALLSLSVCGPMNIERLRRILGITHSTCVRLADRLEATELVRRGSGPDRRAVELALTAAGNVAADDLFRVRARVLAAPLAALSTAERVKLEQMVAKMLGMITADRTSARHICRLCDHHACGREAACPVDAAATELER